MWWVLPQCVYTLVAVRVCVTQCLFIDALFFPPSPSLFLMFSVSPPVAWTCRSLTFMFPTTVVLVSWISLQCFFPCVNGQCNSPSETPSLDTPPGEPPNPPPTRPLEHQIQNQKENQAKKEEGDQTAFIPCIEIHAAGPRRSSEPLPSYLPQPHAEPPLETVTHLIVTSEQRSLSWYIFSKPQISYKILFLLAMVRIHSSCKYHLKSKDSRFFHKIWKPLFTLL